MLLITPGTVRPLRVILHREVTLLLDRTRWHVQPWMLLVIAKAAPSTLVSKVFFLQLFYLFFIGRHLLLSSLNPHLTKRRAVAQKGKCRPGCYLNKYVNPQVLILFVKVSAKKGKINPRLTNVFFVTRLTRRGVVATSPEFSQPKSLWTWFWYQWIGIGLL